MKWKRLTIKTIADAEDIIISDLYDIGLEGAMIEDNVPLSAWEKEQMFVDILPDAPVNDGVAYLSFFVEVPEDGAQDSTGAGDQQAAADSSAEASTVVDIDDSIMQAATDSTAEASTVADADDSSAEVNTAADVDGNKTLPSGLDGDIDNSYFLVSSGAPVDMEALVANVQAVLDDIRSYMDIGEGTITISETEDKDWLNNWKQFFTQFTIDDLLITPSWEEVKPEDGDKKVLHIDPGTAFGTGMHETTQLCIKQLKKYITPDTVLLDVGTGSGILAIVSLLYGIQEAVGTDLDPCAVDAVATNLEMNGVDPALFTMMIGNIISDKDIQDKVGYEKYDIVVANILAEVLVALTPVIVAQMKPGAVYITSGILNEKADMVCDAVTAAGLTVVEVTSQGEWSSVTARK